MSRVGTGYDHNPRGAGSESTVARLAAEVQKAAGHTARMNQAITRVVAEVHSLTGEIDELAGEVGALAAESGQESPGGSAPAR